MQIAGAHLVAELVPEVLILLEDGGVHGCGENILLVYMLTVLILHISRIWCTRTLYKVSFEHRASGLHNHMLMLADSVQKARNLTQ